MDKSLRLVLERHVSKINVDAILRQVYQAEQIQPADMTAKDLERIFQNSLFKAIRMFCEPRVLTTVMLELAELLDDNPAPKVRANGEKKWK